MTTGKQQTQFPLPLQDIHTEKKHRLSMAAHPSFPLNSEEHINQWSVLSVPLCKSVCYCVALPPSSSAQPCATPTHHQVQIFEMFKTCKAKQHNRLVQCYKLGLDGHEISMQTSVSSSTVWCFVANFKTNRKHDFPHHKCGRGRPP